MISTLRKAVDLMEAWRAFRKAMTLVHDGTLQTEVLNILGPPDQVRRHHTAGIGWRWEYHDRLPGHVDFVVTLAGGAVRAHFTRDVPSQVTNRRGAESGSNQ